LFSGSFFTELVRMVALDNTALLGEVRVPRLRLFLTPLVAAIALGCAAVGIWALVSRDFSDNGFRLASQLAWRYAFFVFFLSLVGGPICRIAERFVAGFKAPPDLSRRLVWGFCASYGIYLLSVFLPHVIDPSAGAALMVLFGGLVVAVMAVTVAPLTRRNDKPVLAKARRALLVAATCYFWLCYSIMALARLSGPHRPDAFYDIGLSLMVVGLLVRFADRWFSDFPRPAGSEQTVSNLRQVSLRN
jgi:hypothetical protein